jgi:hypothetical protein
VIGITTLLVFQNFFKAGKVNLISVLNKIASVIRLFKVSLFFQRRNSFIAFIKPFAL